MNLSTPLSRRLGLGHAVGLIHEVQPIGALVEAIAREAHDALAALA